MPARLTEKQKEFAVLYLEMVGADITDLVERINRPGPFDQGEKDAIFEALEEARDRISQIAEDWRRFTNM
jgi:hypothetical protein